MAGSHQGKPKIPWHSRVGRLGGDAAAAHLAAHGEVGSAQRRHQLLGGGGGGLFSGGWLGGVAGGWWFE